MLVRRWNLDFDALQRYPDLTGLYGNNHTLALGIVEAGYPTKLVSEIIP